jgi:hypothetical protein
MYPVEHKKLTIMAVDFVVVLLSFAYVWKILK